MNFKELAATERRTLMIGGKETSIELESAFWRVIEQRDSDWRKVVRAIVEAFPDTEIPRSRLLRVWCLMSLAKALRQAQQR
jgi:predicted DNA-binding ribbon-helix-helix protein